MGQRFEVDWQRCTGHLVCAELVPELIAPDDWGYPMFAPRPIPEDLLKHARRARAGCPALALRLREATGTGRGAARSGGGSGAPAGDAPYLDRDTDPRTGAPRA